MSFFLAANEESYWQCEGSHKLVNFFLGVPFLEQLADELFGVDGSAVQFHDGAFQFDEQGAQLGRMLEQRLCGTEPISPLELDAWAMLVGTHTLRHYSNAAKKPVPATGGGLLPSKLQKALTYMQGNLSSSLRLAEIAAAVGMSQYSFSRAFQFSTGTSPHQYLIKLRIEMARELLDSGNLPVSHIARDVGFADQSHLTMHFRKLLGTTPARYRSAQKR